MSSTSNTLDMDKISPPALQELAVDAKALYEKHFGENAPPKRICAVAPGRVNLIGEHTDYTGGFVLPLAIHYSTVVYGSGSVHTAVDDKDDANSSTTTIQLVSNLNPDQVDTISINSSTPPPSAGQDDASKWYWYVVGVVAQYLPDLSHAGLNLQLAFCGNVPLGGGLSSSASLEVATARFLEEVMGPLAYPSDVDHDEIPKLRALRCQKAENDWCHSPCGIMDQYVSSAASDGTLLLIDCRSYKYQQVTMKPNSSVVLVVTNSNVSHSIGGGEYPVRVAQCRAATKALQEVHPDANISQLRDATFALVAEAKSAMDDISFRRARHVVTENARTLAAKDFLTNGNWTQLGNLMNGSHASMRDDYQVSCEEIDILVNLAQAFDGVYGSRLTGGGFGGCTVTLVEEKKVEALMQFLKAEYKKKTGKECDCFQTSPAPGARLLGLDMV